MSEPSPVEVATSVRVVVSRLQRRLREVARTGDLSPSQTSILSRLLRDGPASVSDLARAEGVRPQSLSASITILEGLNFVEGRPDPGDGRRTILSLTDEAREQFLANRAAKTDWLATRLEETLDADELRRAADGLELLRRLVDAETTTDPDSAALDELTQEDPA